VTSGIKPIVNFFIYSSIVISLAATIFTLETFLISNTPINFNYLGLVFCSTLLTYSVHRIVGLRKLEEQFIQGRFKIIRQYKSHIVFYTIASFMGSIYFLFQLPLTLLLLLIIPAIISGLYTIPIFSNNKRLRDFDFIKIILIALTWAAVALTGIMNDPITATGMLIMALLFIEKFLYIFAITLPFDIRDSTIDNHLDVKTFPAIWGHAKTYKIINVFLMVCLIIMFVIGYLIAANIYLYIAIAISYGLNYFAIKISKDKKSDLYYSGLLDGMIIVRSLLLILTIMHFQ